MTTDKDIQVPMPKDLMDKTREAEKCVVHDEWLDADGLCPTVTRDRPSPPAEPKVLLVGHGSNPLKEAMQDVMRLHDRPPASIEERAKAFWIDHTRKPDYFTSPEISIEMMSRFAQAEISRQRPEIERAAVEKAFDELEGEIQDVMGAWGGPERKVVDGMMTELFTRMQAVKTRGEQG